MTATNPTETALAVRDEEEGSLESYANNYQMHPDAVATQVAAIQQCMNTLMKKDTHYGVIPGCQKPSLWQPGAQMLAVMFRLSETFSVESAVENETFISYRVRCVLTHVQTSLKMGEGMGACNSREKKYREQSTARKCPKCEKLGSIVKGREEYGGGWICFAKKGGCGAKFKDDDKAIIGQSGETDVGAVWDLQNTLLKMACKRAFVAATLNVTGASDIFTQDIEDLVDYLPPPPRPATFGRADANPNAGRKTSKWKAGVPTPRWDSNTPPADDSAATATPEMLPADSVERVNEDTGEVTREPKISDAQLKKAHALKRECGITDDDWKARLQKKFGVDSSAKLSKDEASVLIEALQRLSDKAREMTNELNGELQSRGVDVTR